MARFSFSNRWGGRVDHDFIQQCLHRVGALHLKDRVVSQLSGGEAQRIRLAQALAQEADWWLLDEPTSALDLHQQVELESLCLELRKEGKSLLLALHDLNLARRLCSQVWFLDQGRLVGQGTPDQILLSSDFQRIFQVQMELFYNEAGNSMVSPKKIDSQSNFC
jgi:iron complex transport system ATP-binding protein